MLVGWLFRCGLCCYLPERERDRNGYRSMTSANSHRPPWRVEDEQLLRGRGRFIDDAPLAGRGFGGLVPVARPAGTNPHIAYAGCPVARWRPRVVHGAGDESSRRA